MQRERPKQPHYLIVGGGLSGLSVAYFISLIKQPGSYRITIIESTNRWGGCVETVSNSDTGSVYEMGAHIMRAATPNTRILLRLLKSLELDDSLVYLKNTGIPAKKFIYVEGNLLPVTFHGFSTQYPFTRSPNTLILRKLLSRQPLLNDDCTVDEFFRSRYDSEFADYYGSAVVRGIFAGDARKLSMQACLPTIWEQEKLGILGWLGRFLFGGTNPKLIIPEIVDNVLPSIDDSNLRQSLAMSLSNGLQSIISKIINKLQRESTNIKMFTNTRLNKLILKNDKFEAIFETTNDAVRKLDKQFDSVFMACPSYEAHNILLDILPSTTLERFDLNNLPWVSVVSVVLELSDPKPPDLEGAGHLVPQKEDPYVIAVGYDSVAFPALDGPNGGGQRYNVMMNPLPEWLTSSKSSELIQQEILQKAYNVLRTHLKLDNPIVIGQQVRLYKNCIPQYPPGHLTNMEKLHAEVNKVFNQQTGYPHLYLVGSSYDRLGLGNVVHSAAKAVGEELTTQA